jgi:hypothetical protein
VAWTLGGYVNMENKLEKIKDPVTVNQVEIAHDIALMGDLDLVAQRHGVTDADLRTLLSRPEFQQVLHEFQDVMIKEAKYYITSRAKKAVEVVSDIMSDPNVKPNDRLRAAQDILDRAGLVARKQSDINVKNTYNYVTSLSDEELDALIEDLDDGDVIDI